MNPLHVYVNNYFSDCENILPLIPFLLLSSPHLLQPAVAAWRAPCRASATSCPACASAGPERSASAATAARQDTGASPAAGRASAMATPSSASRGRAPASAAGTTPAETSVTGEGTSLTASDGVRGGSFFQFCIFWLSLTGVPMATTATLCWDSHLAANAGRVLVLRGLAVGATLLLPATRTTGTDRSSATVIRVTQVGVGSITASTELEHLGNKLLTWYCYHCY